MYYHIIIPVFIIILFCNNSFLFPFLRITIICSSSSTIITIITIMSIRITIITMITIM